MLGWTHGSNFNRLATLGSADCLILVDPWRQVVDLGREVLGDVVDGVDGSHQPKNTPVGFHERNLPITTIGHELDRVQKGLFRRERLGRRGHQLVHLRVQSHAGLRPDIGQRELVEVVLG